MHAGPTLSATPATSRGTQRGFYGALSVAGAGDGPRRPLRPTSARLLLDVRLAAEHHDQRVGEQQRHLEPVYRHASREGEMRAQRALVDEAVRAPRAPGWCAYDRHHSCCLEPAADQNATSANSENKSQRAEDAAELVQVAGDRVIKK